MVICGGGFALYMYIYCFLEIGTFYNEYISSDNKKQMIYFKFYKRLSAGITASQMLPLIPGFAALALQPELAASFSWAQSTLSMPPLVHFPRSTGLLVTTFRCCHVQGLVNHRHSVWLAQWKCMALLAYSQASWWAWVGFHYSWEE